MKTVSVALSQIEKTVLGDTPEFSSQPRDRTEWPIDRVSQII